MLVLPWDMRKMCFCLTFQSFFNQFICSLYMFSIFLEFIMQAFNVQNIVKGPYEEIMFKTFVFFFWMLTFFNYLLTSSHISGERTGVIFLSLQREWVRERQEWKCQMCSTLKVAICTCRENVKRGWMVWILDCRRPNCKNSCCGVARSS